MKIIQITKPFLSIVFFVFLFGCASKRERTEKFLNENPTFLAEKCAIHFPIKTKFIKGETKIDTLRISVPGIKLPCPEYVDDKGIKQQPMVNCPEVENEKIFFHTTDTVEIESTAKLMLLKSELITVTEKLKIAENNISDLKKALRIRNCALAILGFSILIFTIYKLKK